MTAEYVENLLVNQWLTTDGAKIDIYIYIYGIGYSAYIRHTYRYIEQYSRHSKTFVRCQLSYISEIGDDDMMKQNLAQRMTKYVYLPELQMKSIRDGAFCECNS